MDPFQGQNRIKNEKVEPKYTCGLNLYDGHCTVPVSELWVGFAMSS